MIDSVYRKYENNYPEVLLEKYNFTDDIEIYSDDVYNADSDEEYSDDSVEDNSGEKIRIKKIEYMNLD